MRIGIAIRNPWKYLTNAGYREHVHEFTESFGSMVGFSQQLIAPSLAIGLDGVYQVAASAFCPGQRPYRLENMGQRPHRPEAAWHTEA